MTPSIKTWSAEAPSNIALIKYMGKADAGKNAPANPSLSLTLPNLVTRVEIEQVGGLKHNIWSPLSKNGFSVELSEHGQKRFLAHFEFLQKTFEFGGTFKISSGNSFPSDCGLASSASSFAALTLAASQVAKDLSHRFYDVEELSYLSQMGSGSSCRSFFSPLALWSPSGVRAATSPWKNLKHVVVLIDDEKKRVSSSEAHKRVVTSPLFRTRPERAEMRLQELFKAFDNKSWEDTRRLVWDEFLEMHELFHTSVDPFTYVTPKTHEALRILKATGTEIGDGPLVTMDAGPNIHLLFREDQDTNLTLGRLPFRILKVNL